MGWGAERGDEAAGSRRRKNGQKSGKRKKNKCSRSEFQCKFALAIFARSSVQHVYPIFFMIIMLNCSSCLAYIHKTLRSCLLLPAAEDTSVAGWGNVFCH
ncbi:MAG: hypothetical protein HWN66_16620 [Candidatus Helarchaeota archaeon]|nr:hypothetical protein [Candidatus Helarchaeota archaeon]